MFASVVMYADVLCARIIVILWECYKWLVVSEQQDRGEVVFKIFGKAYMPSADANEPATSSDSIDDLMTSFCFFEAHETDQSVECENPPRCEFSVARVSCKVGGPWSWRGDVRIPLFPFRRVWIGFRGPGFARGMSCRLLCFSCLQVRRVDHTDTAMRSTLTSHYSNIFLHNSCCNWYCRHAIRDPDSVISKWYSSKDGVSWGEHFWGVVGR